MTSKKKKVVHMARVNTRVRQDQQKFIRSLAKKNVKTQGETIREIIDFYINEK